MQTLESEVSVEGSPRMSLAKGELARCYYRNPVAGDAVRPMAA